MDLSPVANTALENNGQEGWLNEGVNDMFLFPPIPSGEVTRNGYRFKLLDPVRNGGKTVLIQVAAVAFFIDAQSSIPLAPLISLIPNDELPL